MSQLMFRFGLRIARCVVARILRERNWGLDWLMSPRPNFGA